MENCSGHFQIITEFKGVAQVAVVSQGHFALGMIDFDRLAVASAVAACGSVANMPYGNSSERIVGDYFLCKDFADKPEILVGVKHTVVIHYNTAAFLPPMLKCVQPVIYI